MVKIQIQKSINNNKKNVHYVPVETEDYDGSAESEVKNYFEKKIKIDDVTSSGDLTNTLRGYPLNGKIFQIPEGYSGLIVKDGCRKTLSVKEDKEVRTIGEIDSFYYWNYDKNVNAQDDGLRMAMEWLPIAKALHSV
uniref:Uncharacterized protein n=1 Tax=Lepeophtheirus salmonis TaxID=72036 RepID=A0A0K2TH36_LEPSM